MEGTANKPKRIQRKEDADYSFGYNESRFSDRTLQIVITMDPQEIRYDGASCLQEDDNHEALQNCTKNATELVQKSSSSDDPVMNDDNGAVKVRTVHVNSLILAASSQFFNKLFSSGMRETEQRQASVHISPSEEQAFIYLLKFMYGAAIEAQSTEELLDVLMLADKFEVASCIHGCTNALESMPMTMESASLLLCLPSSLLSNNVMQPIVKAGEGFLLTHFSNKEFVEEYRNLPLHIIEKVLESDELDVPSEDHVYAFVIDWTKRHYQDQDERREVFQNKLIKLVRFPQMTDYKLAKILSNENMRSASALKLVSEAINFKGGSSSESYNLEDKRFCERSYQWKPIRVIELHTPKREYRVFWDFNVDEDQYSQAFYMWGQLYYLFSSDNILFLYYFDDRVEGERPGEYVVFLRSNLSKDFCEVSGGKVHYVDKETGIILYQIAKMENYNFKNVVHVQAVFR